MIRAKRSLPLLLVLLGSAPALGQGGATQVVNLNVDPASTSSASTFPGPFLLTGNQALFPSSFPAQGRELWRSDGTPQGTSLVKDICPTCSANPIPIAATGGVAFFGVRDGSGSYQLLRSDGTPERTQILTAFTFWREQDVEIAAVDPLRGLLFFVGADEAGFEPWVSDGTVAGTRRIANVIQPSGRLAPSEMVYAAGRVYFVAFTQEDLPELWTTDGTSDGTTRLVAAQAGDGQGGLGALTPFGGLVLFRGFSPEQGLEPWVTDGTPAGTRPLGDLNPGPAGSLFAFFNSFLSTPAGIAFTAAIGDGQSRLFSTNGTPTGTRSILPASADAGLSVLPLGDRFVIPVATAEQGEELWISNGTPNGTRLLKDVCPGTCSSSLVLLGTVGDLVVFSASDGATGIEPWVTDGTTAGTRQLRDLCTGSCESRPDRAWTLGSSLLFSGRGAQGINELWRTDGTPAGTVSVAELPASPPGSEAALLPNGDLLLALGESSGPRDLYRTDGTPGSLERVRDFSPSLEQGSDPRWLAPLGDRLVFIANESFSQVPSLFATQGDTASTVRLTDPEDPSAAAPQQTVVLGNQVLFRASPSNTFEDALMATDGTPAGTRLVAYFEDDLDCGFHLHDGGLYFFTRPENDQHDLWQTDGTAAGTSLVAQSVGVGSQCLISSGASFGGFFYFQGAGGDLWRTDGTAAGTSPFFDGDEDFFATGQMAVVGSRLFFTAGREDSNFTELWVTDGVPGDAVELADIGLFGSELFHFLTPVGNHLVFSAFTRDHGVELWTSDGTPDGTRLLRDFRPGRLSSNPFNFLTIGPRAYFVANDGEHGDELWLTDGTDEGTRLVVDLQPGPSSGFPLVMNLAGDRLVFSASDGEHGQELWITDGTVLGTYRLTDTWPGPASAHPSWMVPVGNNLYFTADDGVTGEELWRLDLEPPAAPCQSPQDLCLLDGRVRVRARWRDVRTGAEGSATAVPFSEETGFFWFFSPGNLELVVKILDGSALNAHLWTFYGALSDVEYEVEVTDLATGRSRHYTSVAGEICGLADVDSVPTANATALAPEPLNLPLTLVPAAASGACVPGSTELCLQGGRFGVSVTWREPRSGQTGTGGTVPGTDESGSFYFFNPGVLELVVKVLDGRPVNGRFWVFFAALSDVEYDLTVTDHLTGVSRTYHNPPGNLCGRADTGAFSDP